jgi:uncharacterized hydrophobic protein (TIGR00271 family)
VIRLEVFGESGPAAVAQLLDASDDASRVRLADATRPGHAVVLASVHPRGADELLDELRRLGVPDAEVTLTREDVLGRSSGEGAEAGLVWEDVLGMAARNSRPIARYLAFMFATGLIASYGVIEYNGILIVGAMAISPDLLPITAVAVGLVDRRLRLAGRALVTLVVGMAFASAAASASAFAQDRFDRIPSSFNIDSTVLGSLTTVNNETIVVALAAGVAGMLALETRASSGVGVAVSVTTIPAAAYLGVAAGLGKTGEARGALEVLGANVVTLVIAASCTLVLQRVLARRAASKREVAPGAAPEGSRSCSPSSWRCSGSGSRIASSLSRTGLGQRSRMSPESPPVAFRIQGDNPAASPSGGSAKEHSLGSVSGREAARTA